MDYSELTRTYEEIEATMKRLEMTSYLVELLKSTPQEIMDKVVYLTQGKLYPDFMGIELGIAEKLALKAISFATGIDENRVNKAWIKSGDLGLVASDMVANKKQTSLFSSPLTVERVYTNYENIAKASGARSQDLKIKLIADLLHDASPTEAKYIVRTVVGKLRLGIADMTILDALAVAFAEKEAREEIERAYNVCSDLGKVAKVLRNEGLDGLESIKLEVGIPLRSMLCERLSSLTEIFEKLGECAFEYKYDGLRIQAHIENGKEIKLFSRHLENITEQFPDIIERFPAAFKRGSAVLEGECVPVDINTGDLLPFQQVSHRRGRKYEIKSAMEDYPVVLFLFDCLYLDGEDLTLTDYLFRRKKLEECINSSEEIRLSEMIVTSADEEANQFFLKSIEAGCEGLIAKSIEPNSFYRAGSRGWQWIKYKREYKSEMVDTVDLVVVGAFAGRGRRAGSYGALLMASYNDEDDIFETVCKLGTGFSDEFLEELPERLEPDKIGHIHARVRSEMKANFWFAPTIVLEVLGAEITLSPVHTCAYNKVREKSGLAIRFPRFTGNWRGDKKGEDATTSNEIISMYKSQLKQVN